MSNGQAGQPRQSVSPRRLTHAVTTLVLGCLVQMADAPSVAPTATWRSSGSGATPRGC